MLVLGVSTGFPAAGRGPVVTCVALDGSRGTPELTTACELKTSALAPLDQLEDLCRKFSSKLSGLSVEAVVLRIADVSPSGNRKAAPRLRLMIEGALAYVCREQGVPTVLFRNGREVGEALGVSKADAHARGRTLDPKRAEAAAAALSGLPT